MGTVIGHDFINDTDKMRDFFVLSKYEFLNSYSYLKEENYQATIDILWQKLGNIPINEKEEIDENFYIWEKGTSRYIIWHWFDARVTDGIGNRYFN